MAKKRTYAKFINGIISCMRTNFARYSPKYEERLERNRLLMERLNKDGTISKKPAVFYRCDSCQELCKKTDVNVDHIEPVVEIGKSGRDYTLDEYLARLDCDIGNLQVLCRTCHDKKSAHEQELRKQHKLKMKGK